MQFEIGSGLDGEIRCQSQISGRVIEAQSFTHFQGLGLLFCETLVTHVMSNVEKTTTSIS